MKTYSKSYYERKLRRHVGQAVCDYQMIAPGDKIILAISGGKDSLVMLSIMEALRRAAPVDYELLPVHIATGFEVNFEMVQDWSRTELGQEIKVIESGISEILAKSADPRKSPCALCSRLRRGVLYRLQDELGASAIALGHHMDDIVETFMLRTFYTGQLGAMAPKRRSNDGNNLVIRPLAYCSADDVKNYFDLLEVDPVKNDCIIRPDGKRDMVRGLLKDLKADNPEVVYSIFAALGNIDERSLCLREDMHASGNRSTTTQTAGRCPSGGNFKE